MGWDWSKGLAATLVAYGAARPVAFAAVAIYRLISFWAVIAVGWVAWFALRSGRAKEVAVVPALTSQPGEVEMPPPESPVALRIGGPSSATISVRGAGSSGRPPRRAAAHTP